MTSNGRRVAIVTGGSEGIGAGVVAGYRRQGWAVVASARRMTAGEDPDVLAVEGDLAEPATADRIVDGALERFGRIDTLVNNAGVYISKPFTDYTAADFALITGVNLAGFLWITQRAVAAMAARDGGHVVNITATLAEVANSGEPAVLSALTKGGLAAATRSLAVEYASRGIRVNAVSPGFRRSAARARSATWWTRSCSWSRRPTSPARSCTSTAARPPATEVRPASPARRRRSAGRTGTRSGCRGRSTRPGTARS
jgi:NAD(P)-dependent dehydrogenase (short-subunit alcohol dehydrogenase family)